MSDAPRRRSRKRVPKISIDSSASGVTIRIAGAKRLVTGTSAVDALRQARSMFGDADYWCWRDVYAGLVFRHVIEAARREHQALRDVNRLLVEVTEKIREARQCLEASAPDPDVERGLQMWRRTSEWHASIAGELGGQTIRWFEQEWHPLETLRLTKRLDELERARSDAVKEAMRAANLAFGSLVERGPPVLAEPPVRVGAAAVAHAVLARVPSILKNPTAWALMSIGVGLEKPCADSDEFWKKRFVHWKTALARATSR